MNLYKVMLVDDEDEVRQAIERRVDWNSIGFEVVASAENGEEALELADKFRPDVVMSDIHMPFIDGLTLCKMLKKQFPGTKIIFFSGYDEFEYAKEAIKLEAEEYILKPVDAEELKNIFLRIKARLDDEYDKRRNIENLEKYYQESLPFLKDQLLIGILEGRLNNTNISQYFNIYQYNIESPFYSVGVLEPLAGAEGSNMNEAMLALSLKQIIDDNLDDAKKYRTINYLGKVIVIALLTSTEGQNDFIDEMDRICKLSAKMLDSAVCAGIGKVVGELGVLSTAFLEANNALSYRMLLDDNQAIYIRDVEPGYISAANFNDGQIKELVKQIKIGSMEDLEAIVDDIVHGLKKSTATIYQLQLYFVEIYVEIMRLAKSYELEDSQINELDRDVYSEIHSFNTLEEMKNWLSEICLTIRSFIRKERQDSTKMLVEKAKEYIAEYYNDSTLSVDRVCSHLGVSATYFSSMFKKEVGISFVTYITNIRMEKAVELLESSDEKSYIIAGMVGYEDPNYFSYVFKKSYGVSPSKYRSKQDANL